MDRKALIQKSLRTAPSGTRSDVNRQAPASVDRGGGMFEAGVIRGVSAITRGEALGHGMWIDEAMLEQTAKALASKPDGVKVRFTHPGMSSDGLGKLLGRFTGGELVGNQVFGDLHFLGSAHKTPDGDLAGYVMDLAEESPDLFGTSIVFERDLAAEEAFSMEYSEEGDFRSPDPMNTQGLPHARLADLKAVDAVDSPAANPEGLFSSEGATMLAEFSTLMGYALGIVENTPEVPEWLPVHPERIRGFTQRYFREHGLQVSGTPDKGAATNLDYPAQDSKDNGKETESMGLKDLFKKGTPSEEPAEELHEDVAEELQAETVEEVAEEVAELTDAEQLAVESELREAALGEKIEELTGQVESLAAELETVKDEHAAELAAKAEELKAAEESAEAKAQEMLAQAGHPPVDVSGVEEDPRTKEERILDDYRALPAGEERAKFRAQHKDIFPNG